MNFVIGKSIFIKSHRNNLEELKMLPMPKYLLKKAESNIFPKNKQLPHSSEYNVTNISRVFHILPTYLQNTRREDNTRREENIGHIVRDKRPITNLSLTYKKSIY